MCRKTEFLLLLTLVLVLFSSIAYGAENTYINITITEKAYQNVTFAKYFWLWENVTGQIVNGYVNITNPSTEPVSDVNVYLDNMTYLATNFSLMEGRWGNQTVYTDSNNDSCAYTVINETPQPLGCNFDLDHDNRTDYVWVNRTHLIFDISSDWNYNSIALGADLWSDSQTVNVDADIVLSNGDIAGRMIINIPDTGTRKRMIFDDGAIQTLTMYEAPNSFIVLHVPELRPGEYSLFNYTAESVIDPPINVETNYSHEQYRKVLAGECFNVTQWATNEFFYEYNLTNVNITMETQGVIWNDTLFNFTFGNLSIHPFYSADAHNVSKEPNTDVPYNRTWYWQVGGGNMTHMVTYNISYEVCAPDSVPASGSYIFLKETLQYRTEGTVSGVEVKEVLVVGKLAFNFTKRIDRPADTLNNTNVTWEVFPKVGTSRNVTYNVSKVTMWVTENLNPNNMTKIKKLYYPTALVNLSQAWVAGDPWEFNYTDGSTFSSPPPIIWMYPFFHIGDVENQILRNYLTMNGEDLYWKYIYVVNGYWLEIEKNVTNMYEDGYRIDVRVWNRGNGYTPQNLTVTVYDFVPSEFIPFNFSINYAAAASVTGPFNGTAYRWDIPPNRTPQNASFAPRGMANSTWEMNYSVNGTGDYRVSELFIVGLDPRLVDGASSHEMISVVSSMVTHTTEMVYVIVVLFLIALNVTNFLITRKKK